MGEFLNFAELNDALAATSKKLEKRSLMSTYLRGLAVEDAALAALYLSGSAFAETDRRGLNAGGSLLSKALAQRSGASQAAMSAAYRRHGDMGAAAQDLLEANGRTGPIPEAGGGLTLPIVEEIFARIAAARGPGAKLPLVVGLLEAARPVEAKYLLKLMLGDMRTGVKQSLVEEAVAAAFETDAATVRRASMLIGNLPEVVRLAAEHRLDEARMKLFHPLGFMLASPVDSVEEAVERFTEEVLLEELAPEAAAGEEAAPGEIPAKRAGLPPPSTRIYGVLEDKYDGIRAQLHCGDASEPGRVELFSRSRDDLSASFPELVEAFAAIPEKAILDGEILAWSPVSAGGTQGRALPFSVLQQRIGRKRVTAEMREQTPVIFMAFDAMFLGDSLVLEEPLHERRLRLERFVARNASLTANAEARGQVELFAETAPQFARLMLAPAVALESAEQLDAAYTEARARGNEGVMLKSLNSKYQPGRRGLAWLKLKRELATLDVVVTGAEFGHGRRAGVLSDYTFAVRDGDALKNVGKAYSGLTDAEIDELTSYFKEHTLEDYGHFRTVQPLKVLEVAFNNVMRSERHESGFALRFPRILRIRDDKPVEEIDTLARVEEIYESQPDKGS
ncbi:DNA ligase-1 [Silvibacterium bohemicum]|uniref:DNA ligase n=1 Tax=Silvibacterium bohemicum TaxID=1577686 RepID=A0A841JWS5_9BACT|nr:ATP-dependent DNA ligase [Silvibacterium bohemicum]MBB6145796.1 DNA ligase-1 [Silvibacterium bohemicum]